METFELDLYYKIIKHMVTHNISYVDFVGKVPAAKQFLSRFLKLGCQEEDKGYMINIYNYIGSTPFYISPQSIQMHRCLSVIEGQTNYDSLKIAVTYLKKMGYHKNDEDVWKLVLLNFFRPQIAEPDPAGAHAFIGALSFALRYYLITTNTSINKFIKANAFASYTVRPILNCDVSANPTLATCERFAIGTGSTLMDILHTYYCPSDLIVLRKD